MWIGPAGALGSMCLGCLAVVLGLYGKPGKRVRPLLCSNEVGSSVLNSIGDELMVWDKYPMNGESKGITGVLKVSLMMLQGYFLRLSLVKVDCRRHCFVPLYVFFSLHWSNGRWACLPCYRDWDGILGKPTGIS